MKLNHEYNEYLIGYVVTDTESDRSLNFQFEKIYSNHPTPDYALFSACEGDETYKDFTDEEREEARKWLRSHKDVKELEEAFTKAMYENENFRENFCHSLQKWEIFKAAYA